MNDELLSHELLSLKRQKLYTQNKLISSQSKKARSYWLCTVIALERKIDEIVIKEILDRKRNEILNEKMHVYLYLCHPDQNENEIVVDRATESAIITDKDYYIEYK